MVKGLKIFSYPTMRRKFSTALVLVLAFTLFLFLSGCPGRVENSRGNSADDFNLLEPVKPKEKRGADWASTATTREELWLGKCGQCHEPEKGIGKYVGEEWKPVILRMMKKPQAYLNASISREIYFYLYEKTTGKKSPEEEEAKEAGASNAGMEHFGD